MGTLINKIPGVSDFIQGAFGVVLDSIFLAQNNRQTSRVINGLVARAAIELGKIGAAGGPDKDPAGDHHKQEIRAVLERAKDLAERLPGKLREQALSKILKIAVQAGIDL